MGKQHRRIKKVHAVQVQRVEHIGQRCRECGRQISALDDLEYAIVSGDEVTCARCVSRPVAGNSLVELPDIV